MSVTQASLLGDTFGSKASGTIPIGGIIMWSGSIASIPTGWALCNGSNGTPNLVDRFIVGSGSAYAIGATGGSANSTLVSHSHSVTSISDPGNHYHNGGSGITQMGFDVRGNGDATRIDFNDGPPFDGIVYDMGAGSHTHNITLSTEGSSATNANLPPYYALAFIMRLS